jgi:hypothetical protein
VSVYIRFFSAADDADAASCLDSEPGSVSGTVSASETMTRDRFLASSALAEWESILTGPSPEGHAQAAPPRVVADDRPRSSSKIFAAPLGLRAALAAADRASLTEAAHQWVDRYGEQYGNFDPGEVSHILCELSWLAKSAGAEGEGVYLWMR